MTVTSLDTTKTLADQVRETEAVEDPLEPPEPGLGIGPIEAQHLGQRPGQLRQLRRTRAERLRPDAAAPVEGQVEPLGVGVADAIQQHGQPTPSIAGRPS